MPLVEGNILEPSLSMFLPLASYHGLNCSRYLQLAHFVKILSILRLDGNLTLILPLLQAERTNYLF